MSTKNKAVAGLLGLSSGRLAQVKLQLRKKIPKLTANDVRRARIPYYEAIASELYEEGSINGAFLLLHLIEHEDEYVRRTSVAAVEERRLRNSRPLLDYFRKSLESAELNKQLERFEEEVRDLLAIARRFVNDPEKHWLAEQFFLIALGRCADCQPSARVLWSALVRYYYARLLAGTGKHLEAMKNLEQADAALESNALSPEDPPKTLEENAESLPLAINSVLFEVNCQLAEDCKGSPAWMSEQYIRDGHKAALKTGKPSIKARSYFTYGKFLFAQGKYQEASEMYRSAVQQAELDGHQRELLCSIALARAVTYHRLKQPRKCEAMFQLVDRVTRHSGGESSGDAPGGFALCRADFFFTATSLELEDEPTEPERIEWLAGRLRQAGDTFRHFGQQDKATAARCLEGLVRAGQRFEEYANELLPAAISTSDAALYRVIDWVGFF